MIGYFARHRTAANLLMAVIVIMGVMSASTLTRTMFPEFEIPVVNISTPYPGAAPTEVEETICRRIEQQIEGIEGIKRVESLASDGLGVTTVSLTDDVDPSEVRSLIDEEISQLTNLPDLAEQTVVELMELQLDVLHVALSGDMPEKDLLAYGERLRDELLDLKDVSDVTIVGFSDHELRVEVYEEKLIAHGLSLQDVSNAIREQSLDLASGDVSVGPRDVKVRVTDQRRWSEQFRDVTIISNTTGARIPLRTLARVSDTFDEDWNYATYNGRRACHLSIGTPLGKDVLVLADRVRKHLAETASSYPDNIEIAFWKDNSTILHGRWSMMVENLLAGVILVFVTLWVFLNGRLALWVALGIPISFLGAISVFESYGMAIDMVSIIGLIVAVGLIVDDAIVIAENVYAHRRAGEGGVEAAINGTTEVALGVVSSMITTLAIFTPLLMLTGMFGKIINVIPFAVIIALVVSLVEAFLILPRHLSHGLPDPSARPHWLRAKIDGFVEFVRERLYGRVLDWSLRNRAMAFSIVFAMTIATCGLVVGGRLQLRPMPEIDTRWIVASIVMPEGTRSEQTRRVVQKVEDAVGRVNAHFSPHERHSAELIKHVSTFFGSQLEGAARGPHLAEVWIEMIDTEERVAPLSSVSDFWKRQVGDLADVEQLTFEEPVIGPPLRAIQIALQGEDVDSLYAASAELQRKLGEFAGVKNIQTDLKAGKEEVRIRLRDSARALGVSATLVANQLRAGFFGEHVQQFQRGDDVIDVSVMLHRQNRSSLDDIEYFQVLTPGGAHVPLYEVAETDLVRGYASLARLDGQLVVNVLADVDLALGNPRRIVADLQKAYLPTLLSDYPGTKVQIRGEIEETNETLGLMIRGAIIGVVGIFVVLAFAFRSYIEPFVVLLAVPLGVMGAILGHYCLGMDISMFSLIGLVSLTGILVNDTIVMVEFIKLRMAQGMPAEQAFSRAGRDRFQAVVLTTATTIMGLLPMLLETSAQATVFKGLVVAIMFGELFSTAMILVLVPCSYSLLNDLGLVNVAESEPSDEPIADQDCEPRSKDLLVESPRTTVTTTPETQDSGIPQLESAGSWPAGS